MNTNYIVIPSCCVGSYYIVGGKRLSPILHCVYRCILLAMLSAQGTVMYSEYTSLPSQNSSSFLLLAMMMRMRLSRHRPVLMSGIYA